jgi:hypothetical protein
MPTRFASLAGGLLAGLPMLFWATGAPAQDPQPWQRGSDPRYQQRDDAYQQPGARRYEPAPDEETQADRPSGRDAYPAPRTGRPNDAYSPRTASPRPPADDAYRPPGSSQAPPNDAYSPPPRPGYAQRPGPYGEPYTPPPGERYGEPSSASPGSQAYPTPPGAPGRPYAQPPREAYNDPPDRGYDPPPYDRRYAPPPRPEDEAAAPGYSSGEILQAGHSFFGSVSKGLASVVEYVFQQQGRPNGYILGEEAGGAFVAGLRFGEGILYTRDAGTHRIYWQGPSIGYDLGGEGSKVMMLVYNLHYPDEMLYRFGGVDGSAYFIGGVGVTFLASRDVVVAPIRAGVGLRLGANIGYLKFTRRPTWNPF